MNHGGGSGVLANRHGTSAAACRTVMLTTKETGTLTTRAQPAIKSVSLSTGVTLPYVVQGDPNGVPVVLLHGMSDSLRSWEPPLPAAVDPRHCPDPSRSW